MECGANMPKLSEDQQNQRRKHILDAAEACFASSGFHSTTMQDICKAAEVSPGALYVYFDSKEALISGLCERDRAEFEDMLAMDLSTGSGAAQIGRLAEAQQDDPAGLDAMRGQDVERLALPSLEPDRKSTRLNSSHRT